MSISGTSVSNRKKNYLPLLILAIATAACLAPFIGKAFSIDDPLFIWAAKQIRSHPLDPYGFSVNWYKSMHPMSEITKNPPLACYYIALASLGVGWSEVGLHIAFLIPAIAAILGTYVLARRFCKNALLAALAVLATPVFLVSGTTVMCDVMMLALWMWAIVMWLRGVERNEHLSFAAFSILAAACALTKYFGAALIPLLFIYTLHKKRRLGWWTLYLIIPAGVLAAYQVITAGMYGKGLLLDAASYAVTTESIPASIKLLSGPAFLGGCLLPVIFMAPRLWSKKAAVGGALIAVALAFAVWRIVPDTSVVLQMSILGAAGTAVIALFISELRRWRDSDSLLLALWAMGTLIFTLYLNWTINGRSILPAVPVMGILLVRQIERQSKLNTAADTRRYIWLLLPPLLIALWAAYGDYTFANSARTAAQQISEAYKNKTMWFEGHWGFQYYIEPSGAKPIDVRGTCVKKEDFIIVPSNNTNTFILPETSYTIAQTIELPMNTYISTISQPMAAGFYSTFIGPLPFSIGMVPPESYQIISPREPMYFMLRRSGAK